jgi:hypothetical protein
MPHLGLAMKILLRLNGLTGDDTETIQLKNGELQLDPSLFFTDAIVLKHTQSNEVELGTLKDKHGLRLSRSGVFMA